MPLPSSNTVSVSGALQAPALHGGELCCISSHTLEQMQQGHRSCWKESLSGRMEQWGGGGVILIGSQVAVDMDVPTATLHPQVPA